MKQFRRAMTAAKPTTRLRWRSPRRSATRRGWARYTRAPPAAADAAYHRRDLAAERPHGRCVPAERRTRRARPGPGLGGLRPGARSSDPHAGAADPASRIAAAAATSSHAPGGCTPHRPSATTTSEGAPPATSAASAAAPRDVAACPLRCAWQMISSPCWAPVPGRP